MIKTFTQKQRLLWVFLALLMSLSFSQVQAQITCPTSNELLISVSIDPSITTSGGLTVCEGGSATLSANPLGGTGTCTIQWQSSPNGTTWTDISGENAVTLSLTNMTTTTQYRATYTCTASGCDPATSNVQTVTVVPDPVITIAVNNPSVCIGGDATLTSNVSGGSGTIAYQWQSSPNGSTWTNISGATSDTYVAPTASAGVVHYQLLVTYTANGCNLATSNSLTVTVLEDPTVTITGDGTTVCVGGQHTLTSTVTGGSGTVSYQWQSSPNGSTWADISGATNSTYDATGLTVTTYYRIVVTYSHSGCNVATSSGAQIIVVPDPTISIVGGLTLCEGGSTTLTSTTGSGTGTCIIQWQQSANGTSGWTDIPTANAATYTTPSLTTTTYYRATYTCNGSNCDPATSNVETITVVPDPVITLNLDPYMDTICVGGVVTVTATLGNGTGTVTYQWQTGPTATGPWTNVGTNSNSYTSAALTADTYIRVQVTTGGIGCDGAASTPVSVIVIPDPGISITGETTLCVGGDADITATVTNGTGNCGIQWQVSTNAVTWTDVPGGTNTVLNTGALSTSHFYRAKYNCSGLDCGEAISNVVQISITNDPSVAVAGGEVTICAGGGATLSTNVTGGAGTASYQWQSSTNNVDFADISGETNSSLTVTNVTLTTYYRVRVTFSASGCDPVYSGVSTINVVPDPIISIEGATTVCVGGSNTLTVNASGGTGTCTIRWQYQVGASWLDVTPAETGSTYTTPALSVSRTYRVRYNCTGGGCDATFSDPVTVTVVPDPTFTTQPVGESICVGGSHTMDVEATNGTPSLNYQWQYNNGGTWVNVSNGTPAGATYTDATATNFTLTGISNPGSYEFRAQVSSTGSGCDNAYSDAATIIVIKDPVVDVQPIGEEICVGGTHTMSVTASGGTPSLDYQWQYNNGGTWVNVSNNTPAGATYTGATTNSLTVAGTTATGNHAYRVVVSASGSDCATVNSDPATITVNPALVIDSGNMTDATICVGGNHNLSVAVTGGFPPLTYVWQYSSDNSNWNTVTNGTPAGTTYTVNNNQLGISGTTATGNHYYRVQVASTGNNCAAQFSTGATVTVVPDPVITAQPNSDSICVGGTFVSSLTATNGTPSLNYQWEYFNGSTWAAVTNGTPAGATYTGATTNSLTVAGTSVAGTYQFRNVISATGSGCDPVISANATLIVREDIAVNVVAAGGSICPGGSETISVAATGGTPSLNYTWEYSANGTSGWATVSNGTPAGATYSGTSSNALQVNGITPDGTYHYRVQVSSTGSGCETATSANMTIIVIPEVTASFVTSEDTICHGGTTTITATVAGGAGTPSYQWQMKVGSGAWTDISGATSLTLNMPSLTETTIFRLLVNTSGSGCDAFTSSEITVVVVPDPTISISGVQDVCVGGSTTATAVVNGGTGTCTIQWQQSTGGGAFNDIPGSTGPVFTTPALSTDVNYRARIICTGNGCCD